MNLNYYYPIHAIVLFVVGELHVEVEDSGGVDEYVLGAEWFWIWTPWVGKWVIAGAHSDDGCACEEQDEPAEEGEDVDGLSADCVGVV